jgi:hypothetical protein
MIYTVAIAICLSATPVSECRDATAVSWILAPEQPDSIGGCMRHGMLYAASTNLVLEGSYAKIFCSSGRAAEKSAEL